MPVEFLDGRYRLRFLIGSAAPGTGQVAQTEYKHSRGWADKLMVWFEADFPAVGNAVRLLAFYREPDSLRIDLRDSEGFRFRISEGAWRDNNNGTRHRVYHLDNEEALSRIRYNDPSYHLRLELVLEHDGRQITLDVPRIEPVVVRPPPRR
ncbi:MAG: hypothetical protein ACYTKD_20980 [Planctomycetota bacterium]